MTFEDRQYNYEKEKASLRQLPMTNEEYEKAIKRLADKWRI